MSAVNPNKWQRKQIPPSALLYRRASFRHFDGSTFTPAAFKLTDSDWNKPEPGLSVNWAKYSTPDETRANVDLAPRYFGILTLSVECVNVIEDRTVVHDPIENNYAHSEIRALPKNRNNREKDTDDRLRLLACTKVHLRIEPDARLFMPLPPNLYQPLIDGATPADLVSYLKDGVTCCNQKEDAQGLFERETKLQNEIRLVEINLTRIGRGTQFTVKHDADDTDRKFPFLCITILKPDSFATCRLSEDFVQRQLII